MEESESRVEMTANSLAPADVFVAERILVRPAEFTRWEAHHDRLMRGVSTHGRLPQQMLALRTTAFSLVHRKALFEYLRHRHVTGERRRKLLAVFYGCTDYTSAVLAEHGNYVRCSSSYLCTQHLAEHLMRDPALARRLGAEARRLLEGSYGWEQSVSELEEIYRAAIERRCGRAPSQAAAVLRGSPGR